MLNTAILKTHHRTGLNGDILKIWNCGQLIGGVIHTVKRLRWYNVLTTFILGLQWSHATNLIWQGTQTTLLCPACHTLQVFVMCGMAVGMYSVSGVTEACLWHTGVGLTEHTNKRVRTWTTLHKEWFWSQCFHILFVVFCHQSSPY